MAAEIKAKHPKVPEVRTFVLDIGSGSASVIPSDPMYTIYAATKAWVLAHGLLLCFVSIVDYCRSCTYYSLNWLDFRIDAVSGSKID